MDRVQVIQGSPPALPGTCYTCNSSERKQFVDWNMSIEFHGAFYICDACVLEAASKLGSLSVQESVKVEKKLAQAEIKARDLQKEVEVLKELLRGYKSLDSYLDDKLGDGRNLLKPSDSPKKGTASKGESVDSGKSRPAESSDEQGVDDVRPSQLIGKPGESI